VALVPVPIDIVVEQEWFCHRTAWQRRQIAVRKDRVPGNGAPTEFDKAWAYDFLGTHGECAGYLYYKPCTWHHLRDSIYKLPDLDDFIDVKTREQKWHSLVVQKNDPKDWAYVLACGHEHPRYWLIGWCWGEEAQQEKYWADPAGGRPAYFVKPNDPILRPIPSLTPELRRRQRVRGAA
jgi:hypothetical protein